MAADGADHDACSEHPAQARADEQEHDRDELDHARADAPRGARTHLLEDVDGLGSRRELEEESLAEDAGRDEARDPEPAGEGGRGGGVVHDEGERDPAGSSWASIHSTMERAAAEGFVESKRVA